MTLTEILLTTVESIEKGEFKTFGYNGKPDIDYINRIIKDFNKSKVFDLLSSDRRVTIIIENV